MEEVVAGIAATFKATIDFRYHRLFPATVNTPEHAEFVAEVATELFGADKVVANLTLSMGSVDFSVMLQQRTGAYFRLGQGVAESGCVSHNPAIDFNDTVIPKGRDMFCPLVERSIDRKRTRLHCSHLCASRL